MEKDLDLQHDPVETSLKLPDDIFPVSPDPRPNGVFSKPLQRLTTSKSVIKTPVLPKRNVQAIPSQTKIKTKVTGTQSSTNRNKGERDTQSNASTDKSARDTQSNTSTDKSARDTQSNTSTDKSERAPSQTQVHKRKMDYPN